MSKVRIPFRRERGPQSLTSLASARPGRRVAIIKGQDSSRWTDFYHAVLTMPWPVFFLSLAGFFLLLNAVFALLYLVDPSGIANDRPGNFWDAFMFSVQTIGAGNYSGAAPATPYTKAIMVLEVFSGGLNLALITGVVFSRFSRPYARILFSDVAVITNFEGVPTLMFRAANQRGNRILDANVQLSFVRQKTTREGIVMRRFEELKLVRARSALFALSWTIMHTIDETSPLYGQTPESLSKMQAELIALLSGTDETLAAMVFARHSFKPHQIRWRHRFVDVLSTTPRGHRMVDLTQFHETVPDISVPNPDLSGFTADEPGNVGQQQ